MRIAIVLACIALLGGCVSYRASRGVAITGGAALVVGVVAAVVDDNSGETDGHAITNTEAAAIILIPVGLVLGLTGFIGMAVHKPPASR